MKTLFVLSERTFKLESRLFKYLIENH